jgi:hypothetical protein
VFDGFSEVSLENHPLRLKGRRNRNARPGVEQVGGRSAQGQRAKQQQNRESCNEGKAQTGA